MYPHNKIPQPLNVHFPKSFMDYFERLESQLNVIYEIAEKARARKLDPDFRVEIPRARDMASRVENLVGPEDIAEGIRKYVEMGLSREKVSLKIIDDIVAKRYGGFVGEKLAEQCVRTALAILTEGLVSAPLEGIAQVKVKSNLDNTNYLAVYFAGPIRAAGGTAAALAILISDYTRRKLGLAPYVPQKQEVERFIEELELYDRESRLQYYPSADEVRFALEHIPIEITGEQTSEMEVSGYRNLGRIETNRLRGGAMLALAEGLIQKHGKLRAVLSRFDISGWEWLAELSRLSKKSEKKTDIAPNWKYLHDVIAGRPTLSYPMAEGGFRLRLGRSRNTGFGAWGIHPATMAILDDFLAVGTQMKTERPGKGTVCAPVDSIEGPIVRMKNGDVLYLDSLDEAHRVSKDVEEILFLGDALVSFGDFLENNHILLPSGYVEEWWVQEYEKATGESIDPYKVTEDDAIEISKRWGIPLHPHYTFFWEKLSEEDYNLLCAWDRETFDARVKGILEKIGVTHHIQDGKILISSKTFFPFLGIPHPNKPVMETLASNAGMRLRPKCKYTVGARMGRPEKAKERKMAPPVHTLFPVTVRGGRTRSLQKASAFDLEAELVNFKCLRCGTISYRRLCPACGSVCKLFKICITCNREFVDVDFENCPVCNSSLKIFSKRKYNFASELKKAVSIVKEVPDDIKGVMGMSSGYKYPEPIEKGVLRAANDISVFKDGTIRFDATDMPLMHFTAKEIHTSLHILKELGYEFDYLGNPLTDENQIVEMCVQDIVIPRKAAEYMLRVAQFVDDLLEKFYGLPPFYRFGRPEDIVGNLVIGLAPHTSAGILARVIGWTEASACFGHPFFHAAKRRNCDGDEDSTILLLDGLLNFSRYYLPESRGGRMDAPLVLSTKIDPAELDMEARNVDIVERYPLAIYESGFVAPSDAGIETVNNRVGTSRQYKDFRFTHHTTDIAGGPAVSAYKTLVTMMDKIEAQFDIARRVRAVDEHDTATRVIKSHFLPDLIGNLRAFSKQAFRCVGCNMSFRRLPLNNRCPRCKGHVVLTVSRASIEKYLSVAKSLTEQYGVEAYTTQRIALVEDEIASVFQEKRKQLKLADFM